MYSLFSSNLHILSIVILTLTSLSIFTNAKIVIETDKPSQECAVHQDEPIGEVMERICEMCHELSSHTKPNMRAECRSECFTTDIFRDCLKMFSPRRHTRHLHFRSHF